MDGGDLDALVPVVRATNVNSADIVERICAIRLCLRKTSSDIAAIDLFAVPTVTFKLLYVLVILHLDRRRLVWINTAANPTSVRMPAITTRPGRTSHWARKLPNLARSNASDASSAFRCSAACTTATPGYSFR